MPPDNRRSNNPLFTGRFEHRSAEGGSIVLAESVLVGLCTYAAVTLNGSHEAVSVLAVGIAFVFVLAAVYQARNIVRGRIDRYTITADGIETVDGKWAWQDVSELYAEGWPEASKVEIKFVVKDEPLSNVKQFLVRPRLTPPEYERLVRRGSEPARLANPSVMLGRYQMPIDSSSTAA